MLAGDAHLLESCEIAQVMAGKKRRQKVRVAHELPKGRKKEIKKALESHAEERSEWDRANDWSDIRVERKLIRRGDQRTIELPLLNQNLGDSWPIPVTIIHGVRPGPRVAILGGMHGDELTGPSACTNLLSTSFTDPDEELDPSQISGTVFIIPVLNLPGYRSKSRYMPDGRDLNREFPGRAKGSTTSRVAHKLWNNILKDMDFIIDLHCAARGRNNMPQVRADLAHPQSNRIAKAFGIEVIVDSKPPRGSLRKVALGNDIGVITYEGGGANWLDHVSVKVAVYGVLNILKSLHVIPGVAHRPRFRLLASGSTWVRASEGGLLDMFVSAGSVVEAGDIIARISDPGTPGLSVDIISPEDGIMLCAATNPFVTAGAPVGHLLPVSKHIELLRSQVNASGQLIICGSEDEPPWREDEDVDEIQLAGEWSGGNVDAEWQSNASGEEGFNDDAAPSMEEEAA